jgi:hypothetical protein
MLKTEIRILINKKSDLDQITQKMINQKIKTPIYILEYEYHYQIDFVSDYEEWELDSEILKCYPEYEFTTDLKRNRKKIRLQLSRYQSELSTDDWGRQIENPLNETKYLIKKSIDKPEKFNSQIKVLFEENEQFYYINIVNGINKTSGEEGFLLLNNFKQRKAGDGADILRDKLYKSPVEAFQYGYFRLQEFVNQDFKNYIENKKIELRKEQKVPRKIIKDFIISCNKCENEGIFKNLDENIIFERRINWQTKIRTEGIVELQEYINSPNQELCARNLKIRSSWDITLSSITIGVKFFSNSNNTDNKVENILQYRRIRFVLKDKKIISITEEN